VARRVVQVPNRLIIVVFPPADVIVSSVLGVSVRVDLSLVRKVPNADYAF
jgi:hypothetical protein